MGRGGGRKRGKGNGPPPFDMGPRVPDPFDMGPGWCGPPGSFGPFHGGPGPHSNFMGDPMMHGPMPPEYHGYGPGYGPMGPGGPMDGCFDGPPMDGPGFGYGPGMPGPYDPMMCNGPGPMPPGIPPPGIPPLDMPLMVPPPVDNPVFSSPWQNEPVPTTASPPTETTVVPDVWGLCLGSEVLQLDPPQTDEQKTKDSKKDKKAGQKKSYNDKPPPPGRSKGVISFIGPTYGYIERDDLNKYSFTFDAFLGVPKNMIPGVRVHFTAYKEKAGECATNVSVPPGGTEEINSTIIEGFVCNVILEQQPGAKPKPGQIEANIDGMSRALLYSEKDYTITLLQGDHVTFNLLTDIVTQKIRATNIRPQTPQTFKITGEKREVGVIKSVKGGSGTIMAANQNNLPFETTENMSVTELTIMDEVDFTVVTIKNKEKAIRVRKLNECSVTLEETMEKIVEDPAGKDKWMPVAPVEEVLLQRTVVFEDISTAQHAGTVLKVSNKQQEQGLLEALVGGTQKQLLFGAADVLTEATMLVGDKVHFNISTNRETKEERAINVEILSETFEESTERRRTGEVVQAGDLSGTIKCHQSPQLLFFHLTEVMEEKKLDISEKVKFSVISLETAEGGNQAIRIKRLIDSVLTPVLTAMPKLRGVAAREKKMTIKLMRDPNDLIKGTGVEVENKDEDPTNDKPASEKSIKMKSVINILRSKPVGSGSGGKDSDSSQRRYGRRSPSLDQFDRVKKRRSTSRERKEWGGRCRYRRSRSMSRGRERNRRQSHSLERKDYNHRSGSKKRTSSKRSRSKERDGSSQRSSKNDSSSVSRSPDRMNDELERKKRELEELNELIYRKRAIVAMEKHGGVPNFFSEVKPREKTCFDYNHGMAELPPQPKPPTDIKPKCILKKRSDHVAGPLFPIQTELFKAQPLDQRLVEQYGYDVETPYKPHSAQPPYTQTSSQKSYYEHSLAGHPVPDLSTKYDPYEQTSREHPSQPSPVRQTPLDPHSSNRPPIRESQEKNPNLNTQLARFLNTLNKGVDAGLLSAMVKESQEEIAGIQEDSSILQKPYCKFLDRGDEDQYRDDPCTEEEPECPHRGFIRERVKNSDYDNSRNEDWLLPHERAIQEGGGFPGILGMMSHSKLLGEPERVEEEDFLYGGKAPAAAEKERCEKPGRSDRYRDNKRSCSARVPVEETREQESREQTQHFDKIKSLLQAIGLNLDTSEVTELADRTQERPYGTKSSKHSSDSSERETKHSSRRGDRHWHRTTDDSDSKLFRSAKPFRSSQREVYLSPQDTSEYGGFLDPEEEAALERARQMQSLTRTVSVLPPTPSSQPGTSYSTTQWNCPEKTQPIKPKSWPSKGCSTNYLLSLPPGSSGPPEQISPVSSMTNTPDVPAGQQAAGVYTFTSPMGQSPDLLTALPSSTHYGQPSSPMIPFAKTQFTQLLNQVTISNSTRDVLSQILQVTNQSRCLKVIETVKSVSGAQQDSPRQNITIPLQIKTQSPDSAGGQPSPPPQSPETRHPPVTEDDIKAKQKKRLEQFNLRMRRKNQERKNDTRDTRKNTTGKIPKVTFANTEPRNVWICGHSLIYWAEMRAKSPEIGMQLGMDPSSVRVWWKGTQGMTWAQLLPQLDQLKIKWPKPDVVILHLGGNDLGTQSPEALMSSVKKDLTSMRSIFPQCRLVWSDILPRMSWRQTEDSEAVDNVRAAINRRAHAIIAELGGTALTHENITCCSDAGLYRPDGVHLSGKGIDTFNLNLQDFLEKWETEANDVPEMT